jgi:hypothetical protein
MTCSAQGLAGCGQYANLGTALGVPACGPPVADQDPSHYFGAHHPGIGLKKYTNGHDADQPPGPTIPAGQPVTWTYVVTNTGDVTLTGVAVADDQGEVVSCPGSVLPPGQSMTCIATGTAGCDLECPGCQYGNLGTAVGTSPCGAVLSDTDPSHHWVALPE